MDLDGDDDIREICVRDKTDTPLRPSFVSGRSLLLSVFDRNHPAADLMIHETGCPAWLVVKVEKNLDLLNKQIDRQNT